MTENWAGQVVNILICMYNKNIKRVSHRML